MKKIILLPFLLIALGFITAGCEQINFSDDLSVENEFEKSNTTTSVEKFSSTLNKELALARSSTARYHNVENALADGYVDINLYIPNMGWHYLKGSLMDADFEVDKPELLVYANHPNGGLKLVALEYAVPLALSVDPPEGFTGNEDVWIQVPDAGIWALHAWIWMHNPEGIFNHTNPLVP